MQVVYGAAKAAAAGFTRGLAVEVGRSGITVNCISLGSIRHGDMARHLDTARVTSKYADTSVQRRFFFVDDRYVISADTLQAAEVAEANFKAMSATAVKATQTATKAKRTA